MASAPTSRRERPAKRALTRAGIIATAVGVLRAEGLDKVTMRRLAQELDTGAASLYVYVRNTAELHAAVLDELLAEVDLTRAGPDVPVTSAADPDGLPAAADCGRPVTSAWRARLTAILDAYSEVLFRYPSLARSALVTWPSGPHFLTVVEAMLAALDDGLVPADRAAWAVDLLLLHVTATAVEHTTRGANTDQEWNALSTSMREVSPEHFPRVAALGAELLSGPGGGRRRWAYDVLLNGVLQTPRP
jgi:AcrR family transcriptional regulator